MMNTPQRTLVLAALCLASGLGAAQTVYSEAGVAAPWLKIPSSARATAMGEATAARAGGVSDLSANPAKLSGLNGQEVALMHNGWLQGMAVENLAWGMELFGNAGLGLGLSYVNFGAIDRYTLDSSSNQFQKAGSYTPYGMSGVLGYGQRVAEDLSLGLAVHYLMEALDPSSSAASTIVGDLGAQWSPARGALALGLSAQSLGAQLDSSSAPANIKAGALLGFGELRNQRFNLAADLNYATADTGAYSVGLGAELMIQGTYAARAGYKFARSGSLSGSVSAGLGARFSLLEVNYAFATMGDLGMVNQIELVLHFEGIEDKAGKSWATGVHRQAGKKKNKED